MSSAWCHPNPVFIDFETQSAADIREVGGRLYANHPSTRVLILSICADDKFHVWIPDHINIDTNKWRLPNGVFESESDPWRLWPSEIKPKCPVTLYRGKTLPDSLVSICTSRPLVAHNAFGFDKHIWDRHCEYDVEWIDTLYLARIAGLPGKLDSLGKSLLGIGKDRASKLLPLLTTARESYLFGKLGYSYPTIKSGDLQAFTRYAVADVEIMRRAWREFAELEVETDVIDVHNTINERGVEVDIPLLRTIERVSTYATSQAAAEIAEMTQGRIPPDKLRSTKVMHEWLEEYGIKIVDDGKLDKDGLPKKSLRKDIVQRYIDSPYLIESMVAVKEIPPVVIDVLKLRMKALRITDAKVKRAQARVSPDSRIRDLIGYHVAHTGRFSSSGVQIHNLPKPLKGVDIEGILNRIDHTCGDVKVIFDSIKRELPVAEPHSTKSVTVDDVCSALIRPAFKASKGKLLCIADYSAVEAKGIAGIAEEEKLLKIFRANGDPYKTFAAKVFNIPIEQVTKEQRDGVGKVGILGLGYGMGIEKCRVFAANAGVDLNAAGITSEYLVNLYRDEYTKIAGWKPDRNESFRVGGIWKDVNKAVMACVSENEVTQAGKCTFYMRGNTLHCVLPSGRIVHYPHARVEDIIPPYVWVLNLPPNPKATVVYESGRGSKTLFGGLICENIVQAICRDLMAIALVRLEREGFCPVLHVHDDITCEVDSIKADKVLRRMLRIMTDPPTWAEGWFPIAAEGYVSPRFTKKPFKGFSELHSKDL